MDNTNDSLVDAKGGPLHHEAENAQILSDQADNQSDTLAPEDDPTQKLSSIQKIKKFLKYKKGKSKNLKALLILAAIIILLAVAGITAAKRYIGYTPAIKNSSLIRTNKKTVAEKAIAKAAKLDGTLVKPENANKHPLAVMIENHPDARPQAGLEQASIVYEAVAEGGITRFMAILGPNESEHVGPIRSARTYFIDWAQEYNAFYTHAGGSGNGLTKIKIDKVLDLDYNFNPNKAFWRESRVGLASEHTLFADTNKLREIADNFKKWSKDGDFIEWQFKTEAAKDKRPQTGQIIINFSSPSYKVVYDYDQTTNNYKRTLAGLAHKDVNSGHQLAPKNIIIQKVTRTEVESLGKAVGQITDIGSGEAWLFFDGQAIEGSWSKKEAKRRTLFYDQEGNEVKFNPGQTFIEILSDPSTFDYQIGEIKPPTTCTESNKKDCQN